MLVPANSPIPQNSLMPPPADEQLYNTYRAAQVINAGITAQAASSCGAPADSFASVGGNVLVQEVLTEQQAVDQYLQSHTQMLAPAISLMSGQGAMISPADIANAPQVVTAGTGAPAITQAQIAAATSAPVDWTQMMTFKPRYQANLNKQPIQMSVPPRPNVTNFPGIPWGVPSGAGPGQCGNPGGAVPSWGLLLLLVGGGIVAYNALKR
jgi:hypothetical protein